MAFKVIGVAIANDGDTEIETMQIARVTYRNASERSLLAHQALTEAREERLRHEVEIVANEGYEDNWINGKNKEMRDAQTERAYRNSPPWVLANQDVIAAEADLRNAQAEMVYAEHEMRAARVAMEFWTSINYREAAASGGLLPDHSNGKRD